MAKSGSRGKGLKAHSKSNYGKIGTTPRAASTVRTSLGRAASAPKVGPKNSGANSTPYVDSLVIL